MKPFAPFALAAILAASVSAQIAQFTDPANLRGERVSPRNGRELPIDGADGHAVLGLQQMLRRLNTRASILNVVAHPDDEDGGMLTLYARGLGARVADIALTRGEGGQNAMTGDFEDALGLLRTQELLANDRYTGVEQMFGTEVDFGFSKTKSEAFSKWTHERVLFDVVRAIRIFRPLVITATFIGAPTDGHGQHQVSGEIAQEAFLAAGNPGIFPELTAEGILPWQPLKMYARVPEQAISGKGLFDYATGQYVPAKFTNYITGVTTTTPPTADIIVHEGTTDPLLTPSAANPADLPENYTDPHAPLSYVQFARIGLGLQKSQIGPGVRTAPPGIFDVPYHLYGSVLCDASPSTRPPGWSAQTCMPVTIAQAVDPSRSTVPSFFDGIDASLPGLENLDELGFPTDLLSNVSRALRAAGEQLKDPTPSSVAPSLAIAAESLDQLLTNLKAATRDTPTEKANALFELGIKRVQLNDALALALGLKLTAESESANLQASRTASATAHLSQSSIEPVVYRRLMSASSMGNGIAGGGRDVQEGEETHLAPGHPVDGDCGLAPGLTQQPTRPYFFRNNIEAPVYQLLIPNFRNAAMTPNALTCFAEVTYKDVRIELGAVALHDHQPVALVPPASLSLSAHAQVLPDAASSTRVSTFLSPTTLPPNSPKLTVPAGWQVTPADRDTDLPGQMSLQVNAPASHRSPFLLQASVTVAGDEIVAEGFRPVGYGDLPRTNFYAPATDRIVPVALKLPTHRRIAYLPGTGDAIPEALTSINLSPTIISIADLTPTRLAQFDTVVLGVRTYNAHPDLHGSLTQALLDFARSGGNVILQYQTAEFTGADAPFPLTLGNAEKVVDENAAVRLLDPASPVLSTPNQLSDADFDGWFEERGHGFLRTWADQYTAPTETHDPGAPSEAVAPQAPQRGGLITVQLGKGHWTYCAFALYRQLPEAVPGSYRLFSNLLALADQPK